jgi:hypothetical protein
VSAKACGTLLPNLVAFYKRDTKTPTFSLGFTNSGFSSKKSFFFRAKSIDYPPEA